MVKQKHEHAKARLQSRQERRRRSQKRSFRARISAKTAEGSPPAMPTAAWTEGSSARRNGLAASSAEIVVGNVGRRLARRRATSSIRAFNIGLSGSIVMAKRPLASVYSCPQ